MIVGKIRIIHIRLDDETAEEAGINECTQHHRSDDDGWIECCDFKSQGGAGIRRIHDAR